MRQAYHVAAGHRNVLRRVYQLIVFLKDLRIDGAVSLLCMRIPGFRQVIERSDE